MITNVTGQDLEKRIEQLVREHIAAARQAVTAAVERAFAKAEGESAQQRERPKQTTQRSRRRRPDEVAALGERFYAAVCDNPGETMMGLAAALGVRSQERSVPVARLKRDDRVRSVGNRSHTRYFPMASETKGEKAVEA